LEDPKTEEMTQNMGSEWGFIWIYVIYNGDLYTGGWALNIKYGKIWETLHILITNPMTLH
jgi:hypothetical protein